MLYTYRTLGEMLARAGFAVEWLEHYDEFVTPHTADWDPEDGWIRRSARFNGGRPGGRQYTSLIADARKPSGRT